MRFSLTSLCVLSAAVLCRSGSDAFHPESHIRGNFLKQSGLGLRSPSNPVLYPRQIPRQETRLAAVTAAYSSVSGAAVGAILKLLSTCGLGAYATKLKILDKNSLSVLSRLVFSIFQPCLLFCNVAVCISKTSRDSPLFLLPLAAAIQIIIGYIVGIVVANILYGKETSDDKKQLIACTTFANSGPLPLVFTDSIFKTHPDPTLLPSSVAFISMYLLMWSPLFWVLGSIILAEDESKMTKAEQRAQLLKRVFSPPILGCLAGLVVGAVPALAKLFILPTGLMNPLFEGMRTLSAAYLPAVLLVLAGSLLPDEPKEPKEPDEDEFTPQQSQENTGLFLKRVATVYISRFLLMPTLAFACLRFIRANVPSIAAMLSDKLLLFILLIQACMPSAQNSTVILQLQGNRRAAASMARTLVAVYVLGVPAMSYWLSRILLETKLLG